MVANLSNILLGTALSIVLVGFVAIPLWALYDCFFSERAVPSKIFWGLIMLVLWGVGAWCYGVLQGSRRGLRASSFGMFLLATIIAGGVTVAMPRLSSADQALIAKNLEVVTQYVDKIQISQILKGKRREGLSSATLEALKEEAARRPKRGVSETRSPASSTQEKVQLAQNVVPLKADGKPDRLGELLQSMDQTTADGERPAKKSSKLDRTSAVLANLISQGQMRVRELRASHQQAVLSHAGKTMRAVTDIENQMKRSIEDYASLIESKKYQLESLRNYRTECKLDEVESFMKENQVKRCDEYNQSALDSITRLKDQRKETELSLETLERSRQIALRNAGSESGATQMRYRNPWDKKTMTSW